MMTYINCNFDKKNKLNICNWDGIHCTFGKPLLDCPKKKKKKKLGKSMKKSKDKHKKLVKKLKSKSKKSKTPSSKITLHIGTRI
ncbi:MAG: hypothetical protein PVI75_01135 [Gammaproteobacteria bacterium]|jgi:hypothetical protein